MPCGPRDTRAGWPRASAALPGSFAIHGAGVTFENTPRRTEGLGGLRTEGGAEVVPAAFGPELAFDPGELLEQRRPLPAELGLAPDALCALDHLPVTLLPGAAERLDEVPVLGDGVGQSLPQRRFPSGLPDPELEPLELLARDGVLGQRGGPVLQVEGSERLELAPDGDQMAGGFTRKLVDQDQPPRLAGPAYINVHTIPTTAPAGTMR